MFDKKVSIESLQDRIKELETSREEMYFMYRKAADDLRKSEDKAKISQEDRCELAVYRKLFARINLSITKEDLCTA